MATVARSRATDRGRRHKTGLRLTVEGIDMLQALITSAMSNAPQAMASALYEEALTIMARSQRVVPVRTGVLKASGVVSLPEFSGPSYGGSTPTTITVEMGYGGPGIGYALMVHEILRYRHDPPTTAKYLELPVLQYAPMLERNYSARVAHKLLPPGVFAPNSRVPKTPPARPSTASSESHQEKE